MMSELKKRIAQGEGVELDFKFRIYDQKKIARTLVAFANTQGGKLLIGVKDNGKIVGVDPEEEFFMIQGAAAMYTKPEVKFESKIWKEGHHLVLEIEVPRSEQKHKGLDDDGRWRTFVRVGDHTLHGNKILTRIWNLENYGANRPEQFDEPTMHFLKLIEKHQPVSISKLYRHAGFPMKKVDQLLAVLVFWGVVGMHISEQGTTYSVV